MHAKSSRAKGLVWTFDSWKSSFFFTISTWGSCLGDFISLISRNHQSPLCDFTKFFRTVTGFLSLTPKTPSWVNLHLRWYHSKTPRKNWVASLQLLWRYSQPVTGFGKKSSKDESFLKMEHSVTNFPFFEKQLTQKVSEYCCLWEGVTTLISIGYSFKSSLKWCGQSGWNLSTDLATLAPSGNWKQILLSTPVFFFPIL